MATPKPYAAHLSVPESMRSSEITVPGLELYHYITDDQLSELSTMRADPVMEVTMGAGGAFVGGLIPALQALAHFNDPKEPMGIIGLLTVLIAVTSLVLSVFSGILWYRRHSRHEGLAATIRSRPKVKVSVATDLSSGGVQGANFC